jgi:serine/threonine protein kinase
LALIHGTQLGDRAHPDSFESGAPSGLIPVLQGSREHRFLGREPQLCPIPLSIPSMPLTNGQTFAGYTIIRLLGSGGMGEVYLAQHPRLPRRDALKLFPASGPRPTKTKTEQHETS